jgi:membrane-bound ClpP family serine protease
VSLFAIALGLFVLAIIVFLVDLFIPTGGVLIGVTGVLAIGAIVLAFMHSTSTGIWMVIGTFLAIPLMFWAFVELWPKTPVGKRLIVTPEKADAYVWSDAKNSDPKELVGALGTVVDELLPSGFVKIQDRKYEAITETGPIEKGKTVKVVGLDLGRLVVTESKERIGGSTPTQSFGLDRPANELNIDSLEG